MQASIWLIIPCAGSGSRLGTDTAKQYLPFMGSTLIDVTLSRFTNRQDIKGIVVAVSDEQSFIEATAHHDNVYRVKGGEERYQSVFNALTLLKKMAAPGDLVAVHDAARPCIRQSILDKLFTRAYAAQSGIILAEPCTQTVKQVDARLSILNTLQRDDIFLAQTPQIFPLVILEKALKSVIDSNIDITDDASAVEWLGLQPEILPGTGENLKITFPQDFTMAESIFQRILEEND